MEDYTALDAAIAALPIQYTATFVPQSISRHAGDKHRSLNWRVSLVPTEPTAVRRPCIADYSQGIGHVPEDAAVKAHHKGVSRTCIMIDEYERTCAETGRYGLHAQRKIPPPSVRDVFYSLVMDAHVLDAGTFEDWASEYGMDTDSRAAEATYRLCVEQSRALVALIGRDALRTLQNLFQDY